MELSQGFSGYVAGGVGSILSGEDHGKQKKKTKKKSKSSLPLSYLFDGVEGERGGLLISSTQGKTTEAAVVSDRPVGHDDPNRHQVASVDSKVRRKRKDESISSSLHVRAKTDVKDESEDKVCHGKPKMVYPERRRKSDFQTDPERDSRTIFIGNLPLGFKKKQLLRMCSEFGQVSSARFRSVSVADGTKSRRLAVIKKEFATDRQGQNAYVVFCEEEAAQRALALHNRVVEERHINVDIAAKEGQRDYKRSVFVGNLAHDIQEEVLREFFATACGPVDRVRVIRDSRTGEGKGFGYVWFTERETVLLALKCHGEEMQGRTMRVFRAKNPARSHGSQGDGGTNANMSGLRAVKGQVPKQYSQQSKRSSPFHKKGAKRRGQKSSAKSGNSKRAVHKGKPKHRMQGNAKHKVQGKAGKHAKPRKNAKLKA